MIPETENPQAKSVYLGKPVRHCFADSGRYLTQSPHCWFSRETAHIMFKILQNNGIYFAL